MAPKTYSHLSMLADTTLTSLYERERLIRLGSHPSSSDDTEIRHSLDTLKLGLGQLESELEDAERSGASSQELKVKEDVVIKLQSQYDRLRGMMNGVEEEEIRPKRGKSIRLPEDDDLEAQRSALFSPAGSRKTVRFSESNTYQPPPIRNDDTPSSDLLSNQQQIMQDQDDSLDRLSESIGRQRELSIQIGDELDAHGELLEDVDGMVDRSRSRLDGARRQLDRFSKKAKDNGSMVVIGVLILVLVILIIIFK